MSQQTKKPLRATHLLIELIVNLRCCFIHDDNVRTPQNGPRQRNKLSFSSAERTWTHREIKQIPLSEIAIVVQYGQEMAALHDIDTVFVAVVAQRVKIRSKSSGEQSNILADNRLERWRCVSVDNGD